MSARFSGDLKLRQMQSEDCQRVANLQSQLDHSGWSEPQWREALQTYPCAWVIETVNELDSQLISYVIYQTLVAQVELLNIGVVQNFQGRGLAFNLISETLSLLPEHSESVFLEVRRSNIPAIGLYTKLGFTAVGERRGYYPVAGGTREDALVYKRNLPYKISQ